MKRSECENIKERLSEYLDEALSGREMRRVAAHLSTCEACRQEFDDLRVTAAVLQREAVPSPAPDFWAKIYAQVRQQSATIPAPRRSERLKSLLRGLVRIWSLPKALATGAAVAVVLFMAFFLRPMEPPALADDVDDLVAQHAQHSAAHPLSEWSRMTFVSSEVAFRQVGTTAAQTGE